jgi:hypothetical protein
MIKLYLDLVCLIFKRNSNVEFKLQYNVLVR